MKRAVLLFVVFQLYKLSFAQGYIPLLQENRTWNVLSVVLPYPTPFDSTYCTITYKITGETNIDTLEYKNVYYSEEQYPSNWSLFALLREDTNKRVWICDVDGDNEFLLYDFSLAAGDSIMAGWWNDYFTACVDSVTQLDIAGESRSKFWLSNADYPDYSETWTEGIGSSCGVLWPCSQFTIVGGKYILLCMSQDEELLYMNPAYNTCYMTTTGIGTTTQNQENIGPNPAHDFLNIENLKASGILSIELFSSSGQKLKSFNPGISYIDLREFIAGLYLLKIYQQNKILTYKIIIK